MTSTGNNSSKNPRSSAKRCRLEIETNHPLSPQRNEKIEYFEAESIALHTSKISVSTIEMYLRIKPVSMTIKKEDIYHTLSPTTILTKLPSFEGDGRNSRSSEVAGRRHAFTKIFGSETLQAEMFERSIKHRVAEFLDGKSSTIMTYGTRDSGKTYTLFGTSVSPGIITRGIELVFSAINCTLTPWYKPTSRDTVLCLDETAQILETQRKARVLNGRSMDVNQISTEARRSLENSRPENADPDGCEEFNSESMYAVWLSFVEIYNGDVYDLLDDAEIRSPLRLTVDNEGRADICSSQKVYAITALEACRILMAGQSRMSIAATCGSSTTSSRSHTIFTMKLLRYQKDRAANETILSTLTFCDLAGSTQFDTHKKRSYMREASNINNSLLVLGRCLKAVSQNQMAPFRESKLTRIFQRAISGQENLSFIINVAFVPNLYIETQNTFNFSIAVRKLIDSRKICKRLCEFKETARGLDTCDSDVVASSIRQTFENAGTAGYSVIAYKTMQEQNKKLMKELEITKVNILNRECAIRQEMADRYSRVIEDLETTYKEHAKKIEIEKNDLLKRSVERIENFYKERIDNLMRHKKRKRGDNGDYIEDNHAFHEELEAENAQITAEVVVLKETINKLSEENKAILCEKYQCSFELARRTAELKKLRQFVRERIHKWGGNDESIENDADLVENLEQLMDERIKRIEKKLEETDEYISAIEDKGASKGASSKQDVSKSENLFNDTSMKMKETGRELSRKEAYIVTLKHRIQMRERQLAEVQQYLDDTEKRCIRNEESKCDQSTNTSFDDYTIDNCSQGDILVSFIEKSSSQLSHVNFSIAERHNFDDWTTVPLLYATQTCVESTKKRYSNVSDIDRRSFFESSSIVDCNVSKSSDGSSKDDSGIGSGLQIENQRSVNISDDGIDLRNEDKCTQTCFVDGNSRIATDESVEHLNANCANSDRQNNDEMLHIAELFQDLEIIRDIIYALDEAACLNERAIIQHERQLLHKERALEQLTGEEREIIIKRGDLFKVIESKMRKYKYEIIELSRKLKLKQGQVSWMSRYLEEYVDRSKSFENKLSLMHDRLNKAFNKCAHEHLPTIESLEEEVLRKSLQINELDKRIAQMQHKFGKGYELFEKVFDFEIVVNRCQRDKNELRRQLYECSEIQLTLEDKFKKLTMSLAEKESELTALKSEVRNITDLNIANNEKVRDLNKQIIKTDKGITLFKEDLQCCEDLCKNSKNTKAETSDLKFEFLNSENNTASLNKTYKTCNDNQDEITHLKMKLECKELETILFKSKTDATIQKDEIFMKHLQNEIDEEGRLLKIVANHSNNFDRFLLQNSTLCSDSLKKIELTKDEEEPEKLEDKTHEDKNSLTINNQFVPKHSNSEALNESLVSNENSIISSDGKNSISIKFNGNKSCQTDSSVRSNVHLSVCETDNSETEVNFNMKSSDIKDKKKMPDWMIIRRIYGKTALAQLSTKCTNINSDSETE